MSATHYTAVLEIQRVDTTEGRTDYGKATPGTRDVAEVARVVIRSASLADLRDKIAAHAALVEDVAK
ncbi:hypothetical protein HOU70_gp54 [Arthrobacter phage Liebe]|uniref:Uncharacterized protein n=2 Tax=Arthrobacter virus Liebe TaxID=2734245 RepID=A0A3G2KHT3_9CAUD|nr:hypothetical protein HOU70_gp54 [Arthrobacter phage Liebe]AYN58535.1 hypothetical protein PBI_MAUREEN_54 [Arthrobacter phage Maureen]AZF93787.1 hypothetical protein PBI_LIEBE_54 [Arthrobacter phage Liebe]